MINLKNRLILPALLSIICAPLVLAMNDTLVGDDYVDQVSQEMQGQTVAPEHIKKLKDLIRKSTWDNNAIDEIKELLKTGINVNDRDTEHNTPLHYVISEALNGTNIEELNQIIDLLVARGANLNAKNLRACF